MNPNNNYMFYPQGQMYPQYNLYPPNYVFQPQMQPQFYYMNPPQAQTMYQPYIQQQQQSQQRIKCNQPKTKDQPERQQLPVKQQPFQQQEVQKNNVKVISEAVINKQISSITRQGFCHYCNKNGKICYYCFNICGRDESSASFNNECRHGFCFDCLMFKFKINPIKIVLRQDWNCPVKNKQCNCSRCTNLIHMDSDQFISNDSVESCNKYAHIIENTKRIKKQYTKKKGIIRETFAMKFHQLDPKKKKQQQSAKKSLILVKLKKQMQFSQECILKLKQQLNPTDEQILHQVVRYNFEQLIELIKEYKSA